MEKAIKAPSNTAAMSAKADTAAVTKPRKQLTAADYLNSTAFRNQLAMALPKHLDTDHFMRSALSEFRLNPNLQKCSVESILGYFMQAAMAGLEPASTLGQCYAVPFNGKSGYECQFIMGYRGMLSLARRSGDIVSVDAQIVHEKDEFMLTYGLDQDLKHVPYLDGDPGAVKGAYCIVRFKDGSYQMRYMPLFEIEKHRSRSKAGRSGPWVTDFDEMCKKTVFRSLFKWLPISIEAASAQSADGNVTKFDIGAAAKAETPEDAIEIEIVAAEPSEEVEA